MVTDNAVPVLIHDVLQRLSLIVSRQYSYLVAPVEAAHVMGPDDGSEPDIYPDFRRLLGPELPLQRMGRFEFYDQARGPDLALAIATGEQRIYANILLTIGVVPPTKQ